jgi:hypothetical protein
MKRPPLLWMILATGWAVTATAWFVYVELALGFEVAAIACGYPDAKGKAYEDCFAKMQHKANSFLFERLVTNHGLWIVVPALVLLAIGVVIATRRARSAA